MNIKKVFSHRLAQARNDRGMTQWGLARKAGISQDWISHFECGRRLPSVPILLAVAAALNCPLDFLFYMPGEAPVYKSGL